MSPLTIVDVVNAVVLAGGVPVFADISRESCSIDPGQAESLIDSDTAVVLITHLHGQTAGAHVFREICSRRGVRLIEDAAQAFGAVEQGRRLGTIGDAGIYSFGFFKNLSTWRGGMVVSNDRDLIERIRARVRKLREVAISSLVGATLSGLIVDLGTWPPLFANITHRVVRRDIPFINDCLDPEWGASRLPAFPENYFGRMRPWQADLALRQLDQLDEDTRARLVRAGQYHSGLDGIPGIITPRPTDDLSNIYTYFPIQMRERQTVLRYAQRHRRDFAAQHLRNCADLPEFKEFYRDCPQARAVSSELILLPTYPRYPLAEVHLNVEVLRRFVNGIDVA